MQVSPAWKYERKIAKQKRDLSEGKNEDLGSTAINITPMRGSTAISPIFPVMFQPPLPKKIGLREIKKIITGKSTCLNGEIRNFGQYNIMSYNYIHSYAMCSYVIFYFNHVKSDKVSPWPLGFTGWVSLTLSKNGLINSQWIGQLMIHSYD